MKTLYLCYLGLREPLVQSQVLPYLREIRRGGVAVRLVTFEPGGLASWPAEDRARWKKALRADRIEWTPLRYHKRPSLLATLYDIAVGSVVAARAVSREKIDVLHARAHVPLVIAMLAKFALRRGKIIFDIRGLVADEYVDAGIWRRDSAVYRVMKWVERRGIRRAEKLVVLTERFARWLRETHAVDPARIEVIPCCTDPRRFDLVERRGRIEVLYAGSVTGLYLLEEMGQFFQAFADRYPQAFFRVLTSSSAEPAIETLSRVGLARNQFSVARAAPEELPNLVRQATVGLSFRKATFSQIAASPTKIAEYLAAGIPVVSNAGIGDTDRILREDRVGVIVDEFSASSYEQAVSALTAMFEDPALWQRCRRSAETRFDLARVGGARYRRVYETMVSEERKTE